MTLGAENNAPLTLTSET